MPLSVLVTAPTFQPITLEEFKNFARIDNDEEDQVVQMMIESATAYCQEVTRRQFATATWDTKFDDFPSAGEVLLPKSPLASVTHVKYWDADGAEQTFSSANYEVDAGSFMTPGLVSLVQGASWPATRSTKVNRVTVRHVSGQSESAMDRRVKLAVSLMTSHMYEHREPIVTGTIVAGVPTSLQSLLSQLTIRRPHP